VKIGPHDSFASSIPDTEIPRGGNVIFAATGKRVRELPIRKTKLL